LAGRAGSGPLIPYRRGTHGPATRVAAGRALPRHARRVYDLELLRNRCRRHRSGHGPVRAAEPLATVSPDTAVDRYGVGGVVAELESEVAGVLGTAAAVYLPSGTMAQQSACGCTPGGPAAARCCSTRSRTWTPTRAAAGAAARPGRPAGR
jgi:hypothetical protein